MKLVFMGTPDFSVPALDALVEAGHDIPAVYTQPPRPAGRGKKDRPRRFMLRAEALGLPVLTPDESLKSDEARATFASAPRRRGCRGRRLWPDPASSGARRAGTHGCLNIHASLLPRWRGAAPIHRAIMAGDAETGVAIMQMEAGLDTGPVLLSKALAIGPDRHHPKPARQAEPPGRAPDHPGARRSPA